MFNHLLLDLRWVSFCAKLGFFLAIGDSCLNLAKCRHVIQWTGLCINASNFGKIYVPFLSFVVGVGNCMLVYSVPDSERKELVFIWLLQIEEQEEEGSRSKIF